MKTMSIAFCAAAVMAFAMTAPVYAEDAKSIGNVVSITGSASAKGADGSIRTLEMNSPINLNDVVTTAVGAKLQIMFNDDSMISQGEKSEMTIDEYVYTPGDAKESNCAAKFTKGIFRVVTGKITDLNPKRFSVGTRMATIGIRGCDLGFKVYDGSEDIFILHLPEGKTIVIQKSDEDNLNDLLSAGNTMYVVEGGVAVSVARGMDLAERTFSPAEALDFYSLSIPGSSDNAGAGLGDQAGQADLGGGSAAGGEAGDKVNAIAAIADSSGTGADAGSQYEDLQLASRPTDRPDISGGPSDTDGPTTGPSQTPKPTTDPGTTPPPTTLPPRIVASGGGPANDYAWAVYSDGTMQADKSFASTRTILTAGEFGSVVNDTVTRNLTGSGTSGAFVKQGTATAVLTGPCSVGVTVGQSATPTWNGSFNLSDTSANTLNFQTQGNILAGGTLSGSLTSYALSMNGTAYSAGSISSQRITGQTIGNNATTIPTITALKGQYAFQHGSAARVDGVFGADLR